jgi:hypothetical protein
MGGKKPMMHGVKLSKQVTKALLTAGATEKIISDAQLILDACIPPVYANRNEQ